MSPRSKIVVPETVHRSICCGAPHNMRCEEGCTAWATANVRFDKQRQSATDRLPYMSDGVRDPWARR